LAHSVRNAFPNVPVILVSGYDDNPANAVGFDFIEKPFGTEAILKAVKRAISCTNCGKLAIGA
jgi:FixJ family two-component response regulator